VHTQRVTVDVKPDASRRYSATLLQPNTGSVLRAPDPNNSLVIEAQRANATETVEISRFYHFDTAAGTFDDPVLQRHGVHIPTDIHIPVRSFSIQVTDQLPVRNAQSLDAAAIIADLRPNQDAFLLVPVPIGPQGFQITSATVIATNTALSAADVAALRNNLVVQPPPPPENDAITAFISDGGIIQLRFVPAINLPGPTALQMTVEVGAAAPFALLNATLNLVP
jgi:hypothetical protein